MSSYTPPVYKSTDTFLPTIFNGKVVFCTGGGSGICKGMVESMMRHGASAAIVGRNAERVTAAAEELTKKHPGRKCIPAQADVRKSEQLAEAVKKTIDEFGRIDFVICGAAGNFLAPISSLSENAFKTVIEIDTIGTYRTVKATLPYVRESRGAYIHVSATLHYTGLPYQAHVSAAKAGVDALSQVIAVEEGPRGVRSNCIAPGPVSGTTGMEKLSALDKAPSKNPTHAAPSVPLQRWGHIEEMGNAAVFLFSPAAALITGQVLVVDGGAVHTQEPMLPYPKSVLDPEASKHLIKARI